MIREAPAREPGARKHHGGENSALLEHGAVEPNRFQNLGQYVHETFPLEL
jgi:hypothetical protein